MNEGPWPKQQEQKRAHNKVRRAIKQGKIKVTPCEDCGYDGPELVAHHDDYTKPLEVRFLCKSDHKKWHQTHEAVYENDYRFTLAPPPLPYGREAQSSTVTAAKTPETEPINGQITLDNPESLR